MQNSVNGSPLTQTTKPEETATTMSAPDQIAFPTPQDSPLSDCLEMRSQTIRSLQDTELRLKTKARAIRKRLAEIRRTTQVAVEAEWTETKDPALSNATKRRIVLDQRIEEDSDHSLLSAELESLELKLEELGYDIEEELRAFQNDHARIIIRSQQTAVMPAFSVFEETTAQAGDRP